MKIRLILLTTLAFIASATISSAQLELPLTFDEAMEFTFTDFGPDVENDDAIWVTEVWKSKEDHDNSLQNEDVRELIGKAFSLMDGKPTAATVMKILGGKGLVN